VLRILAGGIHALLWGVLLSNALSLRRSLRRTAPGEPRVSVLVPARNEARNLGRLLPSLLAQDYPDFEVIVYDDGSTDGTGDVARALGGDRVTVLRGEGPPAGWVGKVHALFQATRSASGEVYLFLDADAALTDAGALRRLVSRWRAVEEAARRSELGEAGGVLSGLPQLRGGGELLVSLVPFAIVTSLPLALVPRTRMSALSSLNGQCWVIGAGTYHRHEPHRALPDEVLEDVMIGRLLKSLGARVELQDLRGEVHVWMYESLADAWRGFRKNVYLLQGGTPGRFLALHGLYTMAAVAMPARSRGLLTSILAMKVASDRLAGFGWGTALLAPVSLILSVLLPIDSAVSHWTGRVRWKGRAVGRRTGGPRRKYFA
jgi:hypothetical protein